MMMMLCIRMLKKTLHWWLFAIGFVFFITSSITVPSNQNTRRSQDYVQTLQRNINISSGPLISDSVIDILADLMVNETTNITDLLFSLKLSNTGGKRYSDIEKVARHFLMKKEGRQENCIKRFPDALIIGVKKGGTGSN